MKTFIPTVALLLIYLDCVGQEENLTAEQKLLSFIQGKWTVDGSETTYLETCDWIEGNHLQCVARSTVDKSENSISYFTYSAAEKVYIYYGVYGSGASRTLRGIWMGNRFVFEGHRQTDERLVRWRVTMKPNNGKIDFREEHSVDNGPWEEKANFQYKPADD